MFSQWMNYLYVNADIQASYELPDKTMGMDSICARFGQSNRIQSIVWMRVVITPFSNVGGSGLSDGTGGVEVGFLLHPWDVAKMVWEETVLH